uniref:NADH-ubiquinone oxidoreductase chain 6 n=1 Tax=Chiton albolineatus TaxID=2719130 RepID=A0A6H1PH20_9MOLL|nr:NADH dehydrogenase subunit 6 [Chiton albolineatus]QIZ12647.1 NADH dehydrogenase subunit 6 [Chiton albolineatus]
MTMLLLFCLVLSIIFILPLIFQPLSLGLLILINSLLMSLCLFYVGESWYGFILFLIYVGGMLVMFAYVTALTPNLKFKEGGVFSLFIFIFSFWLLLMTNIEFFGVSGDMSKEGLMFEFLFHNFGASLFSFFNFNSIIGLVLVLLFILLCVVKICFVNKGALRPFK